MRCGAYGTIATAWGHGCAQRARLRRRRDRGRSRARAAAPVPDRRLRTGRERLRRRRALYDWGPKGYGLVQPVLFTARDGATIAAHVWATRAGPAKRPGIVITNGCLQAPERVYWYTAQ